MPLREFIAPDEVEESTEMDMEDAEDDSHSHGYYYNSDFDREAYYAAFAEVRAELDHYTYREFYYAYRDWENENYDDWWKGENWKDGIQEALCKVQPSNSRCVPADLEPLLSFFKTAEDLEIYKLFGPNFGADLTAICDVVGAENYLCEQFTLFFDFLVAEPEVSLKYAMQFAQ